MPSARNQRIESWWSFFTKSKGRLWKHFFLDLESNGRLDMTSLIDRDCLWFSFASIIPIELDVMKDHWNSHWIRSSRFLTVPGRPDLLYYLPDISDRASDLKLHVNEQNSLPFWNISQLRVIQQMSVRNTLNMQKDHCS